MAEILFARLDEVDDAVAEALDLIDPLLAANNLSDVADVATARTNLGLGALATVTPGTGIAAALAINVGSAGAPVLFNGAGGTPSSLVGTNITGTALGLTVGAAVASTNVTVTNDNATSAAVYPTWVTASTGNLPIRVSSPAVSYFPSAKRLVLNRHATSNWTAAGTTSLHIIGDVGEARGEMTAVQSDSVWVFGRMEGTLAAPTPVGSGQQIMGLIAAGVDTSTCPACFVMQQGGTIGAYATSLWSTTNHATEFRFYTIRDTTTSFIEAMRLKDNGGAFFNKQLQVTPSLSGLGTGLASPVIHGQGADTNPATKVLDSYGTNTGSFHLFRTGRGTAGSSTATQNGDTLGGLGFMGTSAANTFPAILPLGTSGGAFFLAQATENWSGTAQGSRAQLYTTPNTTAVVALSMAWHQSGGVSVGNNTDPGIGIISSTQGYTYPSFAFASLPTGATGQVVYCNNCRMFNLSTGVQEGAGAGTGGLVLKRSGGWVLVGSSNAAAA